MSIGEMRRCSFNFGMAAERFRFAAFLAQPRAAKTLNIHIAPSRELKKPMFAF
jgi:hypothetical protein